MNILDNILSLGQTHVIIWTLFLISKCRVSIVFWVFSQTHFRFLFFTILLNFI